jgi:hypothetical protein
LSQEKGKCSEKQTYAKIIAYNIILTQNTCCRHSHWKNNIKNVKKDVRHGFETIFLYATMRNRIKNIYRIWELRLTAVVDYWAQKRTQTHKRKLKGQINMAVGASHLLCFGFLLAGKK